MRFRADKRGRLTAGPNLRSYDLELPDASLPPQLVDNDFAGVTLVDGVLTWADAGIPVWLHTQDGEPASAPGSLT